MAMIVVMTVVMIVAVIVVVIVVVIVAIKRKRPARSQTEERAVFRRGGNDPRGTFTTDVPVQADDPV